jgi:TetR/AcrR family transcriptional repressor of lmrAB and yxaGH operons
MKSPESKTRIIRATLDLLSQSGLSGVGINQVVTESATPKGSLYHFFPGGKLELAAVALEEAERFEGQWFREIFQKHETVSRKVEQLFTDAAQNLEASGFTKGCPVAAVTLELSDDSESLRPVCRAIFMTWQDIIAAGLEEVPEAERLEVAELILGTLEGALIFSRAEATKDALLRSGRVLGDMLGRKYLTSGEGVESPH